MLRHTQTDAHSCIERLLDNPSGESCHVAWIGQTIFREQSPGDWRKFCRGGDSNPPIAFALPKDLLSGPCRVVSPPPRGDTSRADASGEERAGGLEMKPLVVFCLISRLVELGVSLVAYLFCFEATSGHWVVVRTCFDVGSVSRGQRLSCEHFGLDS